VGGVAPSPVVSVPGFTIVGAGADEPQVFRLYTTDPNVAERIESVYFTVDWGSNEHTNNVLAVQLAAQDGAIVGEFATPPAEGVDSADLEAHYTWTRLGQDTSNETAVETLFANDGVRRVWFNVALPDVVLPVSSQVNLLAYIDNGNEAGDFQVTDGAITTTRNAGAVSSTTALDLTPYLLPAAVG